jgi:hypothetical protein
MCSALNQILDRLAIWPEHIQNLIVMGMSERLGRKVCRVWGERYEDVIGLGEMSDGHTDYLQLCLAGMKK